jgi:hypothetical protein
MLGPFLSNGSVNTFPRNNGRMPVARQQILNNATEYNNGKAVFSTPSVPRGYKQD